MEKLLDDGRFTGWTPKKEKKNSKIKFKDKNKKDYLGFEDDYTIQENDNKEDKSSDNSININTKDKEIKKPEILTNEKINHKIPKKKNSVLNNKKKHINQIKIQLIKVLNFII